MDARTHRMVASMAKAAKKGAPKPVQRKAKKAPVQKVQKVRKATKRTAAPRAPGRPSKYTPELLTTICERLSKGEALAVICRGEGMPAYRTVKDWQDEQSERGLQVSAAIARAREEGYDAIAMEALGIADDGRRDYQVMEDGREVVDHDHIARSRLRVDTRLKLLAKWDPKRYGDKVQLADSDGNNLPAPQFVVNPVAVLKPE